ncbi:MAG: DUF447 domain-containing protein [Haloarculaceae archaeon]
MTELDADGWPVDLRGVTESVVTTRGPAGRWNVAALGLAAATDGPVTARTWGRTRTRRNFRERGGGYVQFTRDPVTFVEAACSVREEPDPVLDGVDAWVRVTAERVDAGETEGTGWIEWALRPVERRVLDRVVPTTNRGHAAVVEATVAASRLDVPAYDAAALRERIAYFETVVETCGGERERAAWERFEDLVDWRA